MTKPLILCSLIIILLGTPCRTSAVGPTAPTGTPLGRAASAAGGTTYYVAPTGDDNNPGTIAYPWRTIQKAADTMIAGDTVYIRAGTYPEQVVPQNSGNAGQPITYAAYPGETAIIDGTDVAVPEYSGLFNLAGRDYIRVSGLQVIHSDYYGIVAENSSYVTIEYTTPMTPTRPASLRGTVITSSWPATR